MNQHQPPELFVTDSHQRPTRKALIAAVEHFDRVNPPESAVEAVDKMLLSGSLTPPTTATDDFDWNGDDVVLPEQPRTAIYRNADNNVVIRQACWPDDDQQIVICGDDNLQAVIDRLCDLAGIGNAG